MPVSFFKAFLDLRFGKLLVLGLAASHLVSGCVMEGQSKRNGRYKLGITGSGKVDSMRLFTSPTVLNFDNMQGSDGFLAKIYAIENGTAKPVEITDGKIEFALYEGLAEGEPLEVWRYEADALKRHMSNSRIGIVYDFKLSWDSNNKPKKKAAVLVRYIAPDGREISALPVVLSLEP